jgi:hypothetical protein
MSIAERPESYRAVTAGLFPHRQALLAQWQAQIEPLVDTAAARHPMTAAQAGSVFEICVGLDLSDEVPYRDALAMLPGGGVSQLLTAAGFQRMDGGDNSSDEVDGWTRSGDARFDLAEVMAGAWHLMVVYDLLAAKPDADRDWFATFVDRVLSAPAPPGVRGMVDELWSAYTSGGRALLRGLGGPVVARPVWHRHAVGDLLLGRALADIKAATNPVNDLDTSLLQLLRYVLFDRADTCRIDTVALYFGYQAVLVTSPLAEILSTVTGDPAASLDAVREQFARRTGLTDAGTQ